MIDKVKERMANRRRDREVRVLKDMKSKAEENMQKLQGKFDEVDQREQEDEPKKILDGASGPKVRAQAQRTFTTQMNFEK